MLRERICFMARPDTQRATRIAKERINYLYHLAKERLEDDPKQSRRAIAMLRDMATKHNIRIADEKRTFCLKCDTLLVPGKTCTVRVHDKRRVLTCDHCGAIKRLGLTT